MIDKNKTVWRWFTDGTNIHSGKDIIYIGDINELGKCIFLDWVNTCYSWMDWCHSFCNRDDY